MRIVRMAAARLAIAPLLMVCTFVNSSPAQNTFSESHPCAYVKREFQKFSLMKTLYPGDQTVDVSYYRLDLFISYSLRYLSGTNDVNVTVLSDSVNEFMLDLSSSFVVDSIYVNSDRGVFYFGGNRLVVKLPGWKKKGEQISTRIWYRGTPGTSGLGSFVFDRTSAPVTAPPAIWTLSEPYGAPDWFPCKDSPADKADSSDVIVRIAKPFYVVSNGNLVSLVDNGDNTRTFHWSTRYPIAHYLISLAIADYVEYRTYYEYSPGDSLPIVNYLYPENLGQTKPQVDKTPLMMEKLSAVFGPYPFLREKYGHAEFRWLGGMEHQTITSIGYFSDDVIVHELAHQWFGDKVTCATWHDIWLNEGFATFSEGLYLELTAGTPAYRQFIDMTINDLIYGAKNAKGPLYVQDIASVAEIFKTQRTYNKGGTVVHMLRGVLGDSLFFRVLREYLDDTKLAYSSATTDDLKNVAERVSGLDLAYFFNEWVYGENYPRYAVTWATESLSANAFRFRIRMRQVENSNPRFFTMPITIKIHTVSGDTLVRVINSDGDQQFEWTLSTSPISIAIDPEGWIMKDIVSVARVEMDRIGTVSEFYLSQNYPNPFNSSTTIDYVVDKTSKVKLALFDVLGREVGVFVDEEKDEGYYSHVVDMSSFAGGVYFYSLQAGGRVLTRKLVHLK